MKENKTDKKNFLWQGRHNSFKVFTSLNNASFIFKKQHVIWIHFLKEASSSLSIKAPSTHIRIFLGNEDAFPQFL